MLFAHRALHQYNSYYIIIYYPNTRYSKLTQLFLQKDGMVGEVLFWVMRRVVGDDHYHNRLHQAWVKVYSRMLRTIVPKAISYELQSGLTENQKNRSTGAERIFSTSHTAAKTAIEDESESHEFTGAVV